MGMFKGKDVFLVGLKGDKGDKGEQGIQGEKGDKGDVGVTLISQGQPTFYVKDEHLFVRIIKGTTNPYKIDENGHLILTTIKEA